MTKSRFSYLKLAAVVAVLGITIVAGVLLVYSKTNPPQNKFSVKDATTREDNDRRIRAKAGYELVKDGNNVSARRLNKPTETSTGSYTCGCNPKSPDPWTCSVSKEGDGGIHCGGDTCCRFRY